MPCHAWGAHARLGERVKQGLHVASHSHAQALRRRLGGTQRVIQATLDAGVVQLGGRLGRAQAGEGSEKRDRKRRRALQAPRTSAT